MERQIARRPAVCLVTKAAFITSNITGRAADLTRRAFWEIIKVTAIVLVPLRTPKALLGNETQFEADHAEDR
jgi:hypothetical protein